MPADCCVAAMTLLEMQLDAVLRVARQRLMETEDFAFCHPDVTAPCQDCQLLAAIDAALSATVGRTDGATDDATDDVWCDTMSAFRAPEGRNSDTGTQHRSVTE